MCGGGGMCLCGWVYVWVNVFVWCVGVCDVWTCGRDSCRQLALFCVFLFGG